MQNGLDLLIGAMGVAIVHNTGFILNIQPFQADQWLDAICKVVVALVTIFVMLKRNKRSSNKR